MMELDERRHLVAYKGIAKNKPGKMGYMAPGQIHEIPHAGTADGRLLGSC